MVVATAIFASITGHHLEDTGLSELSQTQEDKYCTDSLMGGS